MILLFKLDEKHVRNIYLNVLLTNIQLDQYQKDSVKLDFHSKQVRVEKKKKKKKKNLP